MRDYLFLVLCLFLAVMTATAQEVLNRNMLVLSDDLGTSVNGSLRDRATIRGIQNISGSSGIAFTDDSIYRTDSAGREWKKLDLPISRGSMIADVEFRDNQTGTALIADHLGDLLVLANTSDGGNTWQAHQVVLPGIKKIEVSTRDARIAFDGRMTYIEFRIQTSSNFEGSAIWSSSDGRSWRFVERSLEMRAIDGTEASTYSGDWTLSTEGRCVGYKTGCYQASIISIRGIDATPPDVAAATEKVRARAELEAASSPLFSAPPGGTTRISLNRGFDKCTAGTVSQMLTWWNNSWFYDSNIYMSGRNRACSQPQLTAAWVDQVTAMGWGLIPTIVGYQSPCINSSSQTIQKHSYDPVVSEQQGRGEADIAVADAINLGLTAGSILYYDMERYDPPTPDTLGCRPATVAFLKGWTDRVKELGYKSGTYGSPKNAQEDWVNLPPASKMDAIWMARWDNVPSVWTYITFPNFPTNEWANHQRIKQWEAPHNETWGGVTFNIDGNISDAPVAGLAIPRNKNADFDGDQRTDISVFRPETGVWYALMSSNGGFSAIGFGLANDVLTPGDYDGDGKTDLSVFRPENGGWHFLTKAGFYSSRAFGTTGDIPVPADYNGDGKTDVAVFRPSTGIWYISNSDSRGTYTILQFGLDGDKPVSADYDGDGKADVSVFRPSNGAWYSLRSSDGGFTAVQWGLASDRPAQGDFDGDGKADLSVFRDGIWYLLQTTAGAAVVPFGLAGDIPSTGDYDGDGRADFAVFRPSTSVWYLLQSQNGFGAVQFGLSTDRSIPNAYLPQQ